MKYFVKFIFRGVSFEVEVPSKEIVEKFMVEDPETTKKILDFIKRNPVKLKYEGVN